MRRFARPLLYAGVLGVVFGLARLHAGLIGHYDFTGTSRFAWTVVYSMVMCATAYGFGLPDLPRSRRSVVTSSVAAAWSGAAGMSLIQLFVGDALLPRFVVFGSALLLPDWYRICIRLSAGGRTRAEARDRVAVIGSRSEVDALAAELRAVPERPASIVASTTPEAVRDSDGLFGVDEDERPTVVVLERSALGDEAILERVGALHREGVRVRSLAAFYDEWLGKVPLSEMERAAVLFDIGELHRPRYARGKRLIDVPLALLGAVVLGLTAPVVLLGNLLANRGPLIFRQERVGRGGQTFTMLKYRTMSAPTPDVPAAGTWTEHRDPRVTPFGRVLRATHLDELPQVLNIIRGDLSIVGPRPEQPRYVAELAAKLPHYAMRHLVRPGLTGWAQVNQGYAGSEGEAMVKLQYDLWYLRHQSLRLDLRVIGRTLRSVLGGRGGGR